jgi:hypothetical protein
MENFCAACERRLKKQAQKRHGADEFPRPVSSRKLLETRGFRRAPDLPISKRNLTVV